jgi:hypothetical protein
LLRYLPGQEAIREAEIRKDPKAAPDRRVPQLVLESRALDEVIARLERDWRHEAAAPGGVHRLRDPIGGEVRKASRADLAHFPQRLECAQALGQRDILIVLVLVIEVDAIDAEARQRRVACSHDDVRIERGDIFSVDDLAIEEPDLGRDHDLLALAALFQPAADHTLALAALMPRHPGRIDVRGIDHRPAGVDEGVKDGEARLLVGRPVEDVAAERQRRDFDPAVADFALLHHSGSPPAAAAPNPKASQAFTT